MHYNIITGDIMKDKIFEELYKTMNNMNKMFEEMNTFFYENKWDMPLLPGMPEKKFLAESKRKPMMEFEEKNKELIASFELPGIDKKDIDINISENMIEVSAKHKEEKKDKKAYSLSQMDFYKNVRLPEKIDANKVKASFKKGVLKVIMPKQKQIETKKVLIE